LTVKACGDPSPLSALTGLSFLLLRSCELEAEDQTPFGFSSLQPLSTLQQLEELHLGINACAATSLHGLAGLSTLKVLRLTFGASGCRLRSLEGISAAVRDLSITKAPDFGSIVGIEECFRVEKLLLHSCGAVQALRGLTSLKYLMLVRCDTASLESLDLTSAPLQRLSLHYCSLLTSLSGVERLSALNSLELMQCGLTSLQPLPQLGEGLRVLRVYSCNGVQEEVLQLPHVQPSAEVVLMYSNVKEIVLAGGVRRPAHMG
jgi:hypothetical protein